MWLTLLNRVERDRPPRQEIGFLKADPDVGSSLGARASHFIPSPLGKHGVSSGEAPAIEWGDSIVAVNETLRYSVLVAAVSYSCKYVSPIERDDCRAASRKPGTKTTAQG
jgi:hypothetical protein